VVPLRDRLCVFATFEASLWASSESSGHLVDDLGPALGLIVWASESDGQCESGEVADGD